MGRKAGITVEDIVEAGSAIADREGLAAATLSAVAAELGIKTPSLYNHVDGLAGLRRQLAIAAATRLADVFESARRDSLPDSIRSIAHAYRRFVHVHPGLYESLLPAPKPGEDDELYAAMGASVAVLVRVLSDAGLEGDAAIQTIRALRAMLHGFVHLEANDGFGMPVDIDASFNKALDLIIQGLPQPS